MQKPDIRDITRKIRKLFSKRSRVHFWTTLGVKLILVVGAAATAGVAQFAASGGKLNNWGVVGIAAAIVGGIGGLFLAITDHDASEQLEQAHAALEAAKDLETEVKALADASLEDWDSYEEELNRAIDLYTAMNAMRSVIEAAVGMPSDEIKIIDALLEAARRSLRLALGFDNREHWTICIYRAESTQNGPGTSLVCCAQRRSIECDVKLARSWPEGVGVAGAAYSRGAEIIVPDLTAPELGTLYNLVKKAKADDDAFYRSIVAVPVYAFLGDRPWGVVVATSNEPGRFDPDEQPGLRTVTAARALAGMVALAVRIHRAASSRNGADS